jgi:hypothetical protein
MKCKAFAIIFASLFFIIIKQPLIAQDWLAQQVRLELQEEEQKRHVMRYLPSPPPLPFDLTKPVHVIFTFVDHWEPGYGADAIRKANVWYDDYAQMARKHVDADGRCPQHDWFCLYLEKIPLQIISNAVFEDLGEMNIHIHHGTENDDGRDNTDEMKTLIDRYLSYLNKVGACLTAEPEPRKAFAFIHGMWALDNSRLIQHRQYCGCNGEIDLLLSKGCYADFTFPAWGPMQPQIMTAKIFCSHDCPEPKSYDIASNIRMPGAGNPPAQNELIIFEGPWNSTNIDYNEAPSIARMHDWVNYYVHVTDKPNWVFVKVYTHSAPSLDYSSGYSNLVGTTADNFYSGIETFYNDGANYKLHYCTAREAYNIAMAVAEGVATGEPGDYRDYKIPPPVNKFYFCDAFYTLLSRNMTVPEAELEILEEPLPESLTIWTKDFGIKDFVFERNRLDEDYLLSDASTSTTITIPLIIKDPTPSTFYLFGRSSEPPSGPGRLPRSSSVNEWDHY